MDGRARFPANRRYLCEWRDTPQRLVTLPILTPMGQQITLGTVARVEISDGRPRLLRFIVPAVYALMRRGQAQPVPDQQADPRPQGERS